MKLGKLLIRSFEKRSRATAKSRKPRKFTRPKNGFFRLGTENPPAPEEAILDRKDSGQALVSVAPPSQPRPVEEPKVLPNPRSLDRTPAPEPSRALASSELLRPDDRLRQSIEGFLLDQRSPHTQRAYGKDLKRFMQFLAARKFNRGPERLDRSVLIAYKDSLLSEKLEHTTIDRHLATLRSFFRWLVDDGILEKNPAEGVRFLNPKRLSRTNGFSDEEVVRILKQPNLHTRIGAQHYAVLMILFYCGLRRSELCELRNSSLGEERGHRVLRLRGKGNSERVVVVTPPVWSAIRHYCMIVRKDLSRDEFLFSPIRNNRTGERNKGLDPSMIFYIVTRYAKLAGVANRVSPHSCRATAISNARDHNVPDRAIQEFAGWANPDMITRYDKRKSSVENSAAHAIRYGKEERDLPVVRAPLARADEPDPTAG
jgi:integrase/recombinase XerD